MWKWPKSLFAGIGPVIYYINYEVTCIYRNYNYFHRNQTSYGNKTNLLIVRNHHPVVFDSIFLSLKITKNASATQAVATQTWGQS